MKKLLVLFLWMERGLDKLLTKQGDRCIMGDKMKEPSCPECGGPSEMSGIVLRCRDRKCKCFVDVQPDLFVLPRVMSRAKQICLAFNLEFHRCGNTKQRKRDEQNDNIIFHRGVAWRMRAY